MSAAPMPVDEPDRLRSRPAADDLDSMSDAARRLAASEARLRRLQESMPAMLQAFDAQGRLLAVSDRWLAKIGYRREEVLGRHLSEFAASSPAETSAGLHKLFSDGTLDDWPLQFATRSGGVLHARDSALLERGADGAPLGGIAVLEDVTEHLQAEQRLRDRRRRLASIIEGTGAGTWEWNVATGEVTYNENWAAMLGVPFDELLAAPGAPWHGCVHPEDRARVDLALEAHFADRSPRYESEMRVRHRDGHWVWVLSRGRLLTRTAEGANEWDFGTHLDLTASKRQQEALRKSERRLARTGQIAGVGAGSTSSRPGRCTGPTRSAGCSTTRPATGPTLTRSCAATPPAAGR